jgi:hypothetical protein
MTILYQVFVERLGKPCRAVEVAAKAPELAAEAAERIVAAEFYGAAWAVAVGDFFAYRVREMTAVEFINGSL